MKISQILLLVAVIFTACKKREEVTPMPTPDPLNLRITEIIDSGTTINSQKYFYDDLGRVTRFESKGDQNCTKRFEYANGKLSKIIVEDEVPLKNCSMNIHRNNEGFVSLIERDYSYGLAIDRYYYDGEGNMIKIVNRFIDTGYHVPVMPWGDTSYFSNFLNHRWTLQTVSHDLYFGGVDQSQKVVDQSQKVYDSEGRLMSTKGRSDRYRVEYASDNQKSYTLEHSDSNSYTFSNAVMSGFAKDWYEKNVAFIKQYYSPNLDVYTSFDSAPILLNKFYMVNGWEATYENGTRHYKEQSSVLKTNYYQLPTQIATTIYHSNGSTSYRKTTIRYEVD